MRAVALRELAAGEEVLTSYVDLSEPLVTRQNTLQERYFFTCSCVLCEQEKRARTGKSQWVSPRTAFRCRFAACDGWAHLPRWGDLPVDADAVDSVLTGACNRCGRRSRIHDAVRVYHALQTAGELGASDSAPGGIATPQCAMRSYSEVRGVISSLLPLLPPSASPLWKLMHSAHVMAIEQALDEEAAAPQRAAELWDDALVLVCLLCAGMQARADSADPGSSLYPPGHPLRSVLLATFGKLLINVPSPRAPSERISGAPVLPADRIARVYLARQALMQARSEARTGFGRDVESDVRVTVEELLHAVDAEMRVFSRLRQ